MVLTFHGSKTSVGYLILRLRDPLKVIDGTAGLVCFQCKRQNRICLHVLSHVGYGSVPLSLHLESQLMEGCSMISVR